MKTLLILISTIFFSSVVFSQSYRVKVQDNLTVDTINYHIADMVVGNEVRKVELYTTPLADGYNIILDSNGIISREGMAKNNKHIGYWRFYENGILKEIILHNRKGRRIKTISIENGQIKNE